MTWYVCESFSGYVIKNEDGETWPPVPGEYRKFSYRSEAERFIDDNNLNNSSDNDTNASLSPVLEQTSSISQSTVNLYHYYSYLKIEVAKLNFPPLHADLASIDIQEVGALEKLYDISNKIAEHIKETNKWR